MKLASLLQPECMLCRGRAADYEEAKARLVGLLAEAQDLDPAPLLEAVAEREKLASTVVAPGVGFPHARTEAVDDFHVVLGTFPEGVPAEGQEAPVRFVALFLMPEGASNLYLRTLSGMAKFLALPDSLDRLVAAADAEALIEVFETAKVLVKDVVTAQDIMKKDPPRARRDHTLREVADLMVMHGTTHVPVTDENGRYLGVVTADRLLRVGLPEYLLSMNSLDFLSDFEPFQELLKQEQSMTVDAVALEEAPVFQAHTPMVVVACKLVREDIEAAAVLEGERLVGMISGLDFVHKVVRA